MMCCRHCWTYSNLNGMDSFAEAERVCSEAHSAIASFVMVEIEVALTSCRIAKCEHDAEERTRFLRRARKAYRTAEKLMQKLKLSEAEFDRIVAQLEVLECELEGMRDDQNIVYRHKHTFGLPARAGGANS